MLLATNYMKSQAAALILCAMLLLSLSAHAQVTVMPATTTAVPAMTAVTSPAAYATGTTVNYVRTWTPQQPDSIDMDVISLSHLVTEVTHTTQYFDGLGRPLQTVNWQASSAKTDIVAPVIYDAYGREQYKYLPYTATDATGVLKTNPFADQNTFYGTAYLNDQGAIKNEQYYYSHTVFEPSPLNRVAKSFAPGNTWAGSEVAANGMTRTYAEKAVSVQYMVNNSSDLVRIWDIGFQAFADANNIPTSVNTPSNRVYAAGSLYKTVTLDEHSNAVVEYKDLEGHVVLKKVQIGAIAIDYSGYTGFFCTFYVYDDLGQLRFVIPPKAVARMIASGNWTLSTEMVKELCFRYEYDQRQRMSAKKVPGSDWVYLVYDSRDRLCYSQDGNMRIKSPQQWAYMLYDDRNRPAETGIMTYSGTWANLISAASAAANATTTNGSESGNLTNATPADLVISTRDYTTGQNYNATNSVTWQDGFTTEDGATVTAQIVSSTAPTYSVSNETVNTKPLPTTGTYTYYPLTYPYYDDYSFGSAKTFSTTSNSSLDAGGNPAATLDAVTTTASNMTRGLPTGSRVRVIEDPANLSAGAWLETVTFYDDKGRAVQGQSDNYKGGTDIATNRYNFTNKPVSSYLAHTNPAAGKSGTNGIGVYTGMLYDHEARILNIKKQVFNQSVTSPVRFIVQNTYDALGQLKTKAIGQKSSTDVTPIESDDYSYNIRGWLKGVNWYGGQTYASQIKADNTAPKPKWFAFDLSYDWGMTSNTQQNGNIAGQRWKSGGNGIERAYGYTYDATNRLIRADFTQNNSGVWATDALLDFTVRMGNGTDAGTAYDENGNILMMQQMGLAGVTKQKIDSLTYAYTGTSGISNKMLYVADGGTQPAVNIGDFNDKNGGTATDYGYDMNGNLITDLNKRMNGATGVDLSNTGSGAGAIIYNHLNLPWQITVKNDDGTLKGTITYIYDATGNKLEKRISEAATSLNGNAAKQTQTAYIGGFVYQNNVLQFLSHEEGRIRMLQTIAGTTTTTNFAYDYFLKDHLGNVRMVLTDEQKVDIYPAATVEKSNPAALNIEKGYYDIQDGNIAVNPPSFGTATSAPYENKNGGNNATDPPVNNNPAANVTVASGYMYKLNGSSNVKTGLGITLKVMAGDNVAIYGKSYYHLNTNQTDTNTYAVSSALLSLLTSFAGGTAVAGKGVTGATLNANTPTTTPLTTLVNNNPTPSGNTTPKAGVNWILFDEQFRPVQTGSTFASGYDPVTAAEKVESHSLTANVSQNGYLYVYCSDESNVDVYFDNLQVIHTHGPLTEETHYYPFGLTMAGISSQTAAGMENKKSKFQGQEFAHREFGDGTGLEMYEFKYRMDDPQLGRFWNPDPLTDKFPYNSTYAFSENKVVNARELEGLEALDVYRTETINKDGTITHTSETRITAPEDALPGLGHSGTLTHLTIFGLGAGNYPQYLIYQPKKSWLENILGYGQVFIYGSGGDVGYSSGNPVDSKKKIATLDLSGTENSQFNMLDLITILGRIPTENGMVEPNEYLNSEEPIYTLNELKEFIQEKVEENRSSSSPQPVNSRPPSVPYYYGGKPNPHRRGIENGLSTAASELKPDTDFYIPPKKDPNCIGCEGPAPKLNFNQNF